MLNPEIINNIMFDFSSEEELIERVSLSEDLVKHDIINQIKDMEFSTYNPITNVGGLFGVINLVFVQMLLLMILKVIVNLFKDYRHR